MRNGVRPQVDAARVAQGLDAAIVGNRVAELDDLRNAPEMFDEAGGAAERLASEIVDGDLSVVQIRIRDSAEILEDEDLNHALILAYRGRPDMLEVGDHEHGFDQVKRDQSHHG